VLQPDSAYAYFPYSLNIAHRLEVKTPTDGPTAVKHRDHHNKITINKVVTEIR